MDKTTELLDRIAALELRVAQLEARPQPAQTISHGGMWSWPWPQGTQITGAIGTNVSRETFFRRYHVRLDMPSNSHGLVASQDLSLSLSKGRPLRTSSPPRTGRSAVQDKTETLSPSTSS